ncbi:unnamed protein product [Dicrocoelium dendriticum]|nr:unnamed protein product [Dicrocoelium dendriticum]
MQLPLSREHMVKKASSQKQKQRIYFIVTLAFSLFLPNATGSVVQHNNHKGVTTEKCRIAMDEMSSMGIKPCIPAKLPISYSTWLSDSKLFDSRAPCNRHAAEPQHWLPEAVSSSQETPAFNEGRINRSNSVNGEFHFSLCAPHHHENITSMLTCCTMEMERNLLHRTQREIQEGLSGFLSRWSTDVSKLRARLRDEYLTTFELFRKELNRTLCSNVDATHTAPNCSQFSAELFHKFRSLGEQLMLGTEDMSREISTPIDNLIMHLLIDMSCQSKSQSGTSTLEEYNEEIRCQKYCQARLNPILDSQMSGLDSNQLKEIVGNYIGSAPTSQSFAYPWLQKHRQELPTAKKTENNWRQSNSDQYKRLYSQDLLYAFRLNRLLMQSLELAETLIEGLTEFNPAQGSCMHKLMRMHRCALCAGEPLTRPCPELCLTIMFNCLKPITELHTSWKRFTEAIKLVVQTLLAKPQLSLAVQFKQLPRRLVAYFRHFLTYHKEWLQPQCSGTEKLLELFSLSESVEEEAHSETSNADVLTQLQRQQESLGSLQLKVDLWAEVWTRASAAVCSESPYLSSPPNALEDCWNGTTTGRFLATNCDFCAQMDDAGGNTQTVRAANELLAYDGYQRNPRVQWQRHKSDGLDASALQHRKPQHFSSEMTHFSSAQQDMDLATYRANELLVRASRNLHWSTDAMTGELHAYNLASGKEDMSNSPSRQTESWVQIPQNHAEQTKFGNLFSPESEKSLDEAEELNTSLRRMAYGPIMSWNARHLAGTRDSKTARFHGQRSPSRMDVKDRYTTAQNKSASQVLNQEQPVNNPSMPQESEDGGSGVQPSWMVYGWPPIPQPPQIDESAKPPNAQRNIPGDNIVQDNEYAGSGFIDTQSGLPSFMEYADYPQLGTFHNLINPSNQVKPEESLRERAPTDDEDFSETEDGPTLVDTSTSEINKGIQSTSDLIAPHENRNKSGKQESRNVLVKSGNQDVIDQKGRGSRRRQIWGPGYFVWAFCPNSVITILMTLCFN